MHTAVKHVRQWDLAEKEKYSTIHVHISMYWQKLKGEKVTQLPVMSV